MNNKFVEIDFKISDEFNALPFEERKKIRRFTEAQRLRSFEQLKALLVRNHKRTLREITVWEQSIYDDLIKGEQ